MTPTQQKHYDKAMNAAKEGEAAIKRLTEDCQKNLQIIKNLQREEHALNTKIHTHEERPDHPKNIARQIRAVMQQIEDTKKDTRNYAAQYNMRENKDKDIQEHYRCAAAEISAQQSAQQHLIDAWKNPTDDNSWGYNRKKYPNNDSWHARITLLISFMIGGIKARTQNTKETSPQ